MLTPIFFCDAKDMLDPKLWMRKSIESFFLFGIVDDESPTCAIPRNGVLKKTYDEIEVHGGDDSHGFKGVVLAFGRAHHHA